MTTGPINNAIPSSFIDFARSMSIVRPVWNPSYGLEAGLQEPATPLFPMENLLFITPAFAQGAPTGGGSTDLLIQIVPFVLIFVVMWFLVIKPQQRRSRDHQDMLKNVRRGDTVVTAGGIVGKITKVIDDAPDIEVEIAEGVRVKVARSMISEVRSKGEPVKS